MEPSGVILNPELPIDEVPDSLKPKTIEDQQEERGIDFDEDIKHVHDERFLANQP